MRLNTDIINFIRDNDDFDDEIKTFLIQSLTLELKRYKADYKRFSEDYDKLISRYVVKNNMVGKEWYYGFKKNCYKKL